MFNTKHAKSEYSVWTGVKAREVADRPLTLKDFEIYQLNGNVAAIAIFEELIPEKKKVYLTPNMIGQLHGLSRDDENIIRTGGVRVMITFKKSKNGREYGTIVDAPAEEKSMTKQELLNLYRSQKQEIDTAARTLENWAKAGKYTRQSLDYGFYAAQRNYKQIIANTKRARINTKTLKKDIEREIKEQNYILSFSTINPRVVQERYKERVDTANRTLASYGFEWYDVVHMTDKQRASIFKLAQRIAEAYGYDSDMALEKANEAIFQTGKTAGQLLRTFNSKGFNFEEFEEMYL